MKLGVMQPYFFPYLGYFDLIYSTDRWIVFDSPQYIRHGWINRNRILHPNEGWQYITVPVTKHPLTTPIHDVQVSNHFDWRRRLFGQLTHYRKAAPFFDDVCELVMECLTSGTDSLTEINVNCLQKVCDYIGISFNPEIYSQMNLDIGPIMQPGDWALFISRALGADQYVNPVGGGDLFNRQSFDNAEIELVIKDLPVLTYKCAKYGFQPNMSIIDVLMWKAPSVVLDHLIQHAEPSE